MKLTLTVTDASASELQTILAALGGSTALATNVVTIGGPGVAAATDDDESSDADVPAGALDKDGLPWNDAVHSTPAKQTSKGLWRRKRGVTDDQYGAFVASARAAGVPAPVPQPAPVPVAAPAGYPAPVPQPVPAGYNPPAGYATPVPQPAPAYVPQPAPVPVPAPQPAPAPVGAPAGMDFNAFMQAIQRIMPIRDANGNPFIDAGYLASVSQRLGVASITDIANNQQLIDAAVNLITNEGRWIA